MLLDDTSGADDTMPKDDAMGGAGGMGEEPKKEDEEM